MHRFFLPPQNFSAGTVFFTEETAFQMHRVLRLKPGQFVVALDGQGREVEVRLESLSSREASGSIVRETAARGEPRFALTLLLALTQREKFEWMLQKCTELGAAHFVPVICARSLQQDGKDAEKKLERWRRIVKEAAEQSRRGVVPVVSQPVLFSWLAASTEPGPSLKLIAWEAEEARSLADVLRASGDGYARGQVLIGPEGGFEPAEVTAAAASGFQPFSLGRRILRMETAAITCTALLMYALGEMEPGA
ncbi:MAG: 16S rRNA (uracil(1498)-N(3))-methyltransferase [Chloroflexi bacterium]|nr:16S rRNA (uracil(1498)-N(3))-methyltransferase [Chloroflexota bacterium]